MNFSAFSARTESPTIDSRASSPAIRTARREVNDSSLKTDKATRRYATTLEKTLATWEIAPEEWADYIAFLSRLLKAIQSGTPGATTLPHSDRIASNLAQCLNPGLPSGVHQKALEVFAYIFVTFGKDHVSTQLHEYLPGLFPLLSFASLSVRPLLYNLLEDYVVCLQPIQLRPVLKSFILSIVPALEDESSEDFDRALTTITRLEHTFLRSTESGDFASFYWQSVFLSVITSPSRRHGALNYLMRRLPKFATSNISSEHVFATEAELAVSPEPGLLIRAFTCGLTDSQMLIQRGFLDLLITHLPLDSPLLRHRVETQDLELLMSACLSVLLRRDMSLNRRVWQWLLGPEPKEDSQSTTTQIQFITQYGLTTVESCLLTAFSASVSRTSERVKPFRIGLSLMDRWEIGGSIIPKIFLPAMYCALRYSKEANQADLAEFMKSVNLFFDGVESKLIWSKLYELTIARQGKEVSEDDIELLLYILKTFHVNEEEMVSIHAPLLTLHVLRVLAKDVKTLSDSRWMTVINALISIISANVYNKIEVMHDVRSNDIEKDLQRFYLESSTITTKDSLPYDTRMLGTLLIRSAFSIVRETMARGFSDGVSKAIHIYVQLLQKIPNISSNQREELMGLVEQFCMDTMLSFDSVQAVIALIDSTFSTSASKTAPLLAHLHRSASWISPMLLDNISLDRPKYNLEAVRLLWRLDSLMEDDCIVRASIQSLVTDSAIASRKDNMRSFLNLWNLSLPQQINSQKPPMSTSVRQTGSFSVSADHDKTHARMAMLTMPLLTALETLGDPTDIAFDDVLIWLNSSTHTESVVVILFEQLDKATQRDTTSVHQLRRNDRETRDSARLLQYVLGHFDNILQHAQSTFWAVLITTQLSPDTRHPPITVLANHCARLLQEASTQGHDTNLLVISILNRLLSAPAFARSALRVQHLGTKMAECLLTAITDGSSLTHTSLLYLTVKALSWQQATPQITSLPRRASRHTRKMSLVTATIQAEDETTTVPTQLIVQLLKTSFSTKGCHPYLDVWLYFAEETLPMIEDVLTSVLIPLTEVLCTQIQLVFNELVKLSTGLTGSTHAPEATISKLLDALEVFLRGAHHINSRDETLIDEAENGTVLSNMTPNLFKSQGPPSKTSKANNRLTAILANKDVVRICIELWMWSSSSFEDGEIDRQSATTSSHNAVRLRNRARHMLEGIFSLEPLESLEVVIMKWATSHTQHAKDTVLSLLHVIRDLRPKNTVPAILDALCSRTNPAILTPSRQSTQTSDLTSAEIVLFYSAYLSSLEDDALEEVWSDCMAYLRDVLSNPLPHRQVLPALIWISFQLGQKLENTNYGERKRMRRELGDNFQRLLAATFAASPSTIEQSEEARFQETEFLDGLKQMDLVVILREVVGRADLLLETSDRVSVCINTISTNLITPSFKSRAFPSKLTADMLALVLRVAKKSPGAKTWRKDVADAFNDPRFIASRPELVKNFWFPVLHQWSMTDKERLSEIIGRLYAPTGAGIMFGVGASAARLDADRKTQLNLRRICLLLLASPVDSQVEHLRILQEKIVELFEASTTSSPSIAIKAELFMLLRALLLSTTPVQFAPLWPIVNDNLQAALLSLSTANQTTSQNNLSMLQACKLLDLLDALTPDEYQLYEWIYLTNTTDAVYHPSDWTPYALADIVNQVEGTASYEDDAKQIAVQDALKGLRTPALVRGAGYDTEDVKVMATDVFISTSLQPFLSSLSINSYESRYRLDKPDVAAFRHILIEDLQDTGTIVT